MAKFNRITDDILVSGFISKDKILEYVSQEDIFQLVFGFKPEEFEYITSPFRDDKNAGCWFEIDFNTNKLRFTDFADTRIINGVRMSNIDCFDAVMIYFGLPSFYKTLEFIKAKLIDGKEIKHSIFQRKEIRTVKREKKKVRILMSTRDFFLQDKWFWQNRYLITKENLIEDKVFPIRKFKLFDTKSGDHTFRTEDIAYGYTEFKSGNKKIYRPKQKGPRRFITNCDADDVGGMHSNIKSGRLLIITKSYKDFRVLRNLGLNVRWLQNEGMFPKSQEFWSLIESFDKVVIFFDNDEAGIKAAISLVELINFTEIDKASFIHLPVDLLAKKISDPSDLLHRQNQQELINFLKYKRILI
jgi:hypothetical protein